MRADEFTPVDTSLSVDPDWETFEQIEPYVSSHRTLAEWLLPTPLWKYLFAPTTVDRETLRTYRSRVVERYEVAVDVYQQAETQLTHAGQVSAEEGTNDGLIEHLDDIERSHFPASLPSLHGENSPEEYDSYSEYLYEIEQAVQRERLALCISNQLLAKPEATFLCEHERDQLSRARDLFSHSIKEGELFKESVEIIAALQERIESWEKEVDAVEQRAEPFLELQKPLQQSGLLADVVEIKTELSSFRDSKSIDKLSHPLVTRFKEVEQTVQSLQEALNRSRAKYAESKLKEVRSSVKAGLSKLKQPLQPAMEQGATIESPDTLLSYIQDLREYIRVFQETPHHSRLSDEQRTELAQYQSELTRYEHFINEKVFFSAELKKHTTELKKLQTNAEPYLNFDRYLTRPVEETLFDTIDSLTTRLETFRRRVDFSVLCDRDTDAFRHLKNDVEAIRSRLSNYNPKFVQRQRKKYAAFFTDIGPDSLDLTKEQEQAVIRNGIYNQVIAAAGTGKTLTLTTRVAYLINIQDVDPDRILVVTYTNEATEEMRARLKDHFGITGVEIRTVHSFGRSIITSAQDDSVDTIDDHQKLNFIDRQIREARQAETSEFLDDYYEFLIHFDDVYYEKEEFETKAEYVQARTEEDYVTLKGTEVKSRAEKLIADFLYTHQVEYRYEDRATWAKTSSQKAGYDPDFYLPEDDVYIEHWGIDESGSVAPWFSQSSADYREKMRWARRQFGDAEYDLVETYEFEHEANRLKQALRHRLLTLGVELDQMDFEELVETAFDYDQREGWIKRQFRAFIENAKRFDVTPKEIKAEISPQNPRQYNFCLCGIHLMQQYALYLVENRLIDFTDMIRDAVSLVQDQPHTYRGRYDHILVDEFQDIGKGKMELIQALTGPDAAKLFAVGDDWQSIYSFQGATVEYFTEFEQYFGDPIRTDLTANFRSPPQIIDAGNQLIEYNTNQLTKTVQATISHGCAPRVHTLRGYSFYDYVRRVRRYTVELIEACLADGAEPDEIMILCRYDNAVPYLDEIKQGLRSQEIPYVGKSDRYYGPTGEATDGVSVYSLYQAKGREAKHVVLVHAAEGPYGFPPDHRENELLKPVQPPGLGGLEEERRAFYVAVTRAEQTLDLLTRAEHKSQFLSEIDAYTETVDTGRVEPLEDVGDRMSVEVMVEKLLDPWAKQQQRGFFGDKFGGSARFISWENDNPPILEQGEWYRLSGLLVGKFKGEKELVITSDTSVTHFPDGSEVVEPARLQEMD